MQIKALAIMVATGLSALEKALEAGGHTAAAEELKAKHKGLRSSLYRHRGTVGLSDSDVADIDNAGVIVMGGTPKGPAEDVE